jgi:hypothetical protein
MALGTGTVNISGGSLIINHGISIANAIRMSDGNLQWQAAGGTSLATIPTVTATIAALDTTARFLGGTTSAAGTLQTSFSANSSASNDAGRQSAVFSVSGVPIVNILTGQTDIFVLQLGMSIINTGSFLGWFDPSSDMWVNAVDGNFNSNASMAQLDYKGSFSQFRTTYGTNLSTYLGAWGTDVDSGTTWAVLNHNSSFSVIPEPSELFFLSFGLAGILGIRRRVGCQ